MAHLIPNHLQSADVEKHIKNAQRQVRAIFPEVDKDELDEQFKALLCTVLEKAERLENPEERRVCITQEIDLAVRLAFEEYLPKARVLH